MSLCPPVITSELWPLHSWTRLLHVQYKHTLCLNPLRYSHQTHPWHTVEGSSVAARLGINKATDISGAEPRGWCLSSAQSRPEQLEPVVLLNTFISPLCKNFHQVLGSNKSNIKSFPTSKTHVMHSKPSVCASRAAIVGMTTYRHRGEDVRGF